MSAERIRDLLTDNKAPLSMAIFPQELYKGTYTKDLFADDGTTFFDDTEQFLELQKQAVDKLVEDFKAKGFAPVTILGEDERFQNWQYRPAKKKADKKGGVVIEFRNGNVQVHAGIVSVDLDKRTREATAKGSLAVKKPVQQYPRPLCEYIAMQKSVALQKALLDNPRVAREVAVVLLMGRKGNIMLNAHKCLDYFQKDASTPLAYIGVEEIGRTLATALGIEIPDGSTVCSTLLHSYHADLYAAVKTLSDDRLNDLHLFLTTLSFGQADTNFLDTNGNSLFNRVAKDLNVDMRGYWTPDEAFLSRRNKTQLEQVLAASGAKKKFGNLLQGKKADLVKKLSAYFKSLLTKKSLTDEEKHTRNWLPEAMFFPAVNPDAAAQTQQQEPEDEGEGLSVEDGEEEESLSDDEEQEGAE